MQANADAANKTEEADDRRGRKVERAWEWNRKMRCNQRGHEDNNCRSFEAGQVRERG